MVQSIGSFARNIHSRFAGWSKQGGAQPPPEKCEAKECANEPNPPRDTDDPPSLPVA